MALGETERFPQISPTLWKSSALRSSVHDMRSRELERSLIRRILEAPSHAQGLVCGEAAFELGRRVGVLEARIPR